MNRYQIRCAGQRILVKRLSADEVRGIRLPNEVKKTSLVGEVLAKGPDADWVSVGDVIHFARFSGCEVKKDGVYVGEEYDECLYMNCEDILGILDPMQEEEDPAKQPEEVATVQ